MEVLSERLVQQVSERGGKIPEQFIQKESIPEAIDAPDELWKDTLLIDFSLLSSSLHNDHELDKLKSALSNWGCFQVKNHGIETSFLEEFIEISKKFFALPLEEKLKSSAPDSPFQGYGSDSGSLINQTAWNDRLYLTLHPEERRNLDLWPQKPLKFKEILNEYTKKLLRVIEGIYKAMARSLKLEEEFFLNQTKEGLITGRLTMYPPCPCPECVIGIRPHSDGSIITALLAESGVEGLQVQKEDQWFKVPVIPRALFFNLGDLGELMTNGIFKSVVHRVVTNSSKDRISWASFCTPGGNVQVGPLSDFITDNQPQLYKKITMNEFSQIYITNTAAGRRPLHVMKL